MIKLLGMLQHLLGDCNLLIRSNLGSLHMDLIVLLGLTRGFVEADVFLRERQQVDFTFLP